MYTLSLMMNFVVVTVYWSVIHKGEMEEYKNNPGHRLHLKLVHTIPGAVCLINAGITNVMLKHELYKFISIVAIIYFTFSWWMWFIYGRIQYHFLNFNQGI